MTESYCLVLAFSSVAENTMFLCDLVLQMPDISHKIIDESVEYMSLVKWSVGFMNDTAIYEGQDAKVLSFVRFIRKAHLKHFGLWVLYNYVSE